MPRIAIQNVKSRPRMRIAKVQHDIQAVRDAHPGIILWSEISPKDYKSALRSIFSAETHDHYGLVNSDVPITVYRKNWQVDFHTLYIGSDAIPTVCPVRKFTCVHATHHASKRNIAFISVHFVPGAFQRGWRPFKKARQANWQTYFERLQEVVNDLYAQGFDIIIGGDWNAHSDRILEIHSNAMEWTKPGSSMDHILYIPRSGARFRLGHLPQEVISDLFTDHEGKVIQFYAN